MAATAVASRAGGTVGMGLGERPGWPRQEGRAGVVRRAFKVMAPMGLHLRSAALLAKTASRYDSRITVRRNERQADAKSVLSVVMLEAAFGATVVVEAEGRDADNAMMAVGGLFAAGFPETDAPAPGMPRPARNRTLDAAGVPS